MQQEKALNEQTLTELQTHFVKRVLYVVRRVAAAAFHGYRDKMDLISEAEGTAWRILVRGTRAGKSLDELPTPAVVEFSIGSTFKGCGVSGQLRRSRDVMTRLKRSSNTTLEEFASTTGRQPSVFRQFMFSHDFPAWLNTLDDRMKKFIQLILDNPRITGRELKAQLGVSGQTIANYRNKALKSWLEFTNR